MKNIYFIVLTVLLLIYVIHIVKKGKLSIKESFWWVIGAIVALFLAIFPTSIDAIAGFIGVNYPPTLMLVICIQFLLFMLYRNSAKMSEQGEKIMDLTQQVSILKSELEKKTGNG